MMRMSKRNRQWRIRLWPKSDPTTAANGHLILSWPDADHDFFTLLCLWIRLRYKLRRVGHSVYSPHELILPDLVGSGFKLKRGWDNWSGYHLLAEDHAGDEFLRRFTDAEQ